MGNQALSQSELDLLLNGLASEQAAAPEADSVYTAILSASDEKILAETVDASLKNATESLSMLVKRPVKCSFPVITETTWDGIKESGIISPEHLAAQVSYIEGLTYDNFLIMKMHDAATIVDLMLGGDGRIDTVELDDLKMSAIGEAMNQMMGSSATALSNIFGKKVIISTPTLKTANLYEEDISFHRMVSEKMILVEALLTVALDEPLNADIYQIIPIVNATEMIAGSKHESSTGEIASVPGAAKKGSQESMIARQPDEKKITVQPVQFMSLDVGATKKEGGVNKMELIYDVGLQLTVELGRTEKTLKEVLEIGPGSVVGLDRLAGEPLDILVNGKLLARGEVIVIDENYGVRIKEIINSGERIGNLKT